MLEETLAGSRTRSIATHSSLRFSSAAGLRVLVLHAACRYSRSHPGPSRRVLHGDHRSQPNRRQRRKAPASPRRASRAWAAARRLSPVRGRAVQRCARVPGQCMTSAEVVLPMPRLGLLMMRSKARSSSGCWMTADRPARPALRRVHKTGHRRSPDRAAPSVMSGLQTRGSETRPGPEWRSDRADALLAVHVSIPRPRGLLPRRPRHRGR